MNLNSKLAKSTLVGVFSIGLLASPLPANAANLTTNLETAIVAGNTGVAPVGNAASVSATDLATPLANKSYRLTSYFGERCTTSTGAGFWHNAVDLAAPDGTPIYSIADGTVESFQSTANGRTGVITVNHGTYKGKKLIASYAHMWEPSKYVKVGQKVSKGQQISEVGSSGISSGPHIHFVINHGGVEIDPIPFMQAAGVDFTKEASSVRAKPAKPTTCDMYTWANVGLKEKPDNLSKTIMVINRGDMVIGYTGKSTNGYYKVKDVKTGKVGYLYSETLGANKPTARILKTSSGIAKNVRYTASGTWHMRDYPSVAIGMGGILDTIKRGEFFTTTGRQATGSGYTWYEVKYDGKTGWVPNHGIIEAPNTVTGTGSTTKNATYTPNASTNIRNYPETSSKFYTTYVNIKKGAKVVTTGRTKGSYYEVTYNKKTYWAHKSYIHRVADTLPKTTSLTKNITYKAKANNTQVRNYPSNSEAQGWSLRKIAKNSSVKTTGRKYGSWIEVTSGSTKGWVETGKMTRVAASLPKLSNVNNKNQTFKAKANNTQIRNYPSTNETQGWSIKTVNKNSKMTTTGKKYGSWYQVKSGSTTGWVQTSKISRTTANFPKLKSTTKNATYKAKSNQVVMNYPSASTVSGWKITTVKKNATVKTTGRINGSFIEVTSGKTKGWVNKTNFTLVKGKTESVKNYKLKKKLTFTASHTGGKKTTIAKNKTVKTTGWAYGSKVEVTYSKKKYWIAKSSL